MVVESEAGCCDVLEMSNIPDFGNCSETISNEKQTET